MLTHLFPVPKSDARRVVTFSNENDFISMRHHTFEKSGHQMSDVSLSEVGPRWEMRLYRVRLGTVDMQDADDEWVYRPYLNTAKKNQAL